MLTVMAILAGMAFVGFAVKIGLYETWAMLFNIVISIYLAVFLAPAIADSINITDNTAYNNVLVMAAVAIVTFLLLHGSCYLLITGQSKIQLPKALDTIGSGLLGFLAGLLVWNFVILLIYVTPLSQSAFAKKVGLEPESAKAGYICWWCNRVNQIASGRYQGNAESLISRLLRSDAGQNQYAAAKETGQDVQQITAEPAEPMQVSISKLERFGPPPEANAEEI